MDGSSEEPNGVTGLDASALLLTASEAASLCHVVPRTWRTWHATGKIPQPIHIGRKPLWRPEELRAWIAAGCPDRATWTVLRK
jgi:predicted DNA-binding transcriptional regulator AlpA